MIPLCPPEGGNTEFLCMRAAWDALPPALQATIHPLVAEHALSHSRDRVQKGILSAKALSELPSLEALRAGLVGMIQTPATRIAGILSAPVKFKPVSAG